MAPRLWTLVLAGGSGRRLSKLTCGVPKQFWHMAGGATLLEDTVARLAPLAQPDQRITVVDVTHQPYLQQFEHPEALGQVIFQPSDRGTAAGVLLGLTELAASDSEALVMVTPSDHGVTRTDHYVRGITGAANAVRAGAADVVLLGVEPTWPAGDYGWITPARPASRTSREHRCLPVGGFEEKPGAAAAAELMAAGAVWNTMVLVGWASAIFEACRRLVPRTAMHFWESRHLPPAQRAHLLAAIYPALPPADFSRDVIGRMDGLTVYVWPARIGWSDLGTPDRVREWRTAWRIAS